MLPKKRIEKTGEETKNSLPNKHEKIRKKTLKKQVKKRQKVRKMGGGKEAEKKALPGGGVHYGAFTVGSRFELKQSNTADPSRGVQKERKKQSRKALSKN